ncbi:MAG: hypothetical protein MAG581_01940 [Deltaproteobacteria bacterium]|nr:hypothetical protein [Deltaproteobacteria bacterium]
MNHSLWRLVFDSNVLLSGLLNSKGAPRSVIELAMSEQRTILYSDEVLLEWHRGWWRRGGLLFSECSPISFLVIRCKH